MSRNGRPATFEAPPRYFPFESLTSSPAFLGFRQQLNDIVLPGGRSHGSAQSLNHGRVIENFMHLYSSSDSSFSPSTLPFRYSLGHLILLCRRTEGSDMNRGWVAFQVW
jgi:hypothetical protein